MDETPEELERIREEAGLIDVNRYRSKRRIIYAVGLGGLLAAASWGVIEMVDQRRNPCQRVQDYYCKRDPSSLNCSAYRGILKESESDESIQMRRNVKHQCQRKIEHLKTDDKIDVP